MPFNNGRVATSIAIVLLGCLLRSNPVPANGPAGEPTIRIATYNVSLYGKVAGEVADRLADGVDQQAEKLAAVIQTVRPDVLLLNEVDFDAEGTVAKTFAEKFLAVSQAGLEPLDYAYVYSVPTNTGMPSGLDLNGNGKQGEPVDAWGFGTYPGQYAMAVLSRFSIVTDDVRTFQTFLWRDLPGAKRPSHPKTGTTYFSDAIWEQLRLSSKNHADVPILVGNQTIHLLASHPTPPVFDGPEDHNGCRNHDEIKFWEHYIGSAESNWIVDDQGNVGGLADDASFVIAGDLNSNATEGDGQRDAMISLLADPRVQDVRPRWMGQNDPTKMQTAMFGRARLMRIDYVLPSASLQVIESGVFWPDPNSDPEGADLVTATDHRLVWIEVAVP